MTGIAIMLLTIATAAVADQEAGVETITVTGIEQAEQRASSAFTTRIILENRRLEFETGPDLLAESAGVHVRRFGGAGAYSTISIRGSSPNQVQFFIDGVPISEGRNETVDLSFLPIDSLDTLEIYRGTVPVSFGGSGGNHAVNLVTRAPSSTPRTELIAGYGSFETYRASGTHTQRIGAIDLLAHLSSLGSKGDFEFLSFSGTESDPGDDVNVRRRNNRFYTINGLLKADTDISSSTRARLTQVASYRDAGVPGPDSRQVDQTHQQNIRSVTTIAIDSDRFPIESIDSTHRAYVVYQQLDFDDPEHELGPTQDTRDRSVTLGANTTGTLYGLRAHEPSWFAEIAHENFDAFNETSTPVPDLPDQRRLRINASLQDSVQLLDDRIVVLPAIRFQHLEDRFSQSDVGNRPAGATSGVDRDLWSPSIGLVIHAAPWLSFRGNLGRYQRPPNFSELFGNAGVVVPSPDLVPETATQRDVGFRIDSAELPMTRSLTFVYAYFNNDIDNLIAFRGVSPRSFKAENFENVRVRGHEISLQLELKKYVSLVANYTRQTSKNLSIEPSRRGQPVPLLPRDELYLRPQLNVGPAQLHYEFVLTGANSTTPSAFDTAARRRLHNAGIALKFGKHFSVAFEVANFTDESPRDLIDFPLPRRSLNGSVKMEF